jgi:hypothetical protein
LKAASCWNYIALQVVLTGIFLDSAILMQAQHVSLQCRDIGAMDTHHHTVCLRVKSVLDACDDLELDYPEMAEAEASQQVQS